MKRRLAAIAALVLYVLFIPAVLFGVGVLTPAKYSETYYGALVRLQAQLKVRGEGKIVLIGNSAVPFGVDPVQLEEELSYDGINVRVCNFGLYGAIGTKAMLELAKPWIGENDLVILMLELNRQALSLYFSPAEFWYACDGAPSLLRGMGEELGPLLGAYPRFVAQKLRYTPGGADLGVYRASSFDENCVLSRAVREYNIMPALVDENDPLRFDTELLDRDFLDYVNGWYADIRDRGAEMLWYFAPVNEGALNEDYRAELDTFYDALNEKLDFAILGDPRGCVMDPRWFYDSNVHLNGAGMTVYTAALTDDLKLYYEKSSPVRTQLPPFPVIPADDRPIAGDDSDADLFTYRETDRGLLITGLTEAGKLRASLTVPCSFEGRQVYAFTADTFAGSGTLRELTIQENIRILYDGSFSGCTALERIRLTQTDPERITVGYRLLEGADRASILVRKTAFSAYSSHYFWGHYAGRYETDQ